MPSGAAVIEYAGVRGTVWKIKYRDADGRQTKETLGRADAGWTRQKAERELGKRLGAVEKGLRHPQRRTFDDLCDEFEQVSLLAKPRKKSTLTEYQRCLRNHLRPAFGNEDLVRLSQSPELFELYAAVKLQLLKPKTVRNHLALAGLMFKQARRWRWVVGKPTRVGRPAFA